MVAQISIIFSVTVILLILITRCIKSLKIPAGLRSIPGPRGVPFVGYFPFIGRRVHLTLTDLWQKYGNVYQLKIGSRRLVILNGHDTIRQAFALKSYDFGGRPNFYTYTVTSRDNLIGMNDYSEKYKIAKKLLVKAFGKFCTEKRSSLQQAAHKSVGHLIKIIKDANNEPFDPNPYLYPIVCTIIGYVCWGEFFDINDKRVKHILDNANEFGSSMAFGVVCDFFPCLKRVFENKLQKFETMIATNRAYSRKLACEHVSTYDGEKMRDITDFFHRAADEMPEEKRQILNLTHQNLLSISGGVFGAGFATVAVTIKWAMVLLAKHPKVQEKMQAELDQVLDKDNFPTFDQVETLPYTTAVIFEVNRYASVAHIGFAHKTMRDTEVGGYSVPQGTTILANFYSAHRDPKYFPDPNRFNPERFMTSEYTLNRWLTKKVIAFGLGIRRCGGEEVARLEIYTFIATLFHRCRIEESLEQPIDLDNYKTTVALEPNPFKVIIKSRFGEW